MTLSMGKGLKRKDGEDYPQGEEGGGGGQLKSAKANKPFILVYNRAIIGLSATDLFKKRY